MAEARLLVKNPGCTGIVAEFMRIPSIASKAIGRSARHEGKGLPITGHISKTWRSICMGKIELRRTSFGLASAPA